MNAIPETTRQPVLIVWMEDELLHTDEHPYCDDLACFCHIGEVEVPFTDEEMDEIMAAPSPLEEEVDENYHRHRPLRISAHFQGMMDSLLLEHD